IVDAPRAEVHLSRRCLLRHLDGTVLDAEIEAAALESLRSIQFELADIHRLRGVEDSALLSAEIPFVQDAVRIAARAARAVVGPGIAADRQIAAEIDPLRGPYGCADADRDLATAAWAGGQILHAGIVRIETKRQAVVDAPAHVEADRFERVRLFAQLLLVAHVFTRERLVVVNRCCNRAVIEDHVICTRAVCEPERPLSAMLPRV